MDDGSSNNYRSNVLKSLVHNEDQVQVGVSPRVASSLNFTDNLSLLSGQHKASRVQLPETKHPAKGALNAYIMYIIS